ncbi:hypothetical protein QOZ80_1BG0067970 [Eleusine coracana subsp. coracana]|nr:hypothetical protein QOZ80_1BG0067970 [Eleusine coracana subsp. coracana]
MQRFFFTKHHNMTIQQFNLLMALFLLLGLCFQLTILAQVPTVSRSNFWKISSMQNNILIDNGVSRLFPIVSISSISYTTSLGFYTKDNISFILAIVFYGRQGQIIWSANPDNLVSNDAILNFTREGDLVLQDSDERTVWSIATKSKSVLGMSLDASGNLVLFNQKNLSVWQSFDHPTDTLVMGQSLCRGMNLSAKPSNTKWPSAKVYLSADYNGLRYSFAPTAYSQLFQASTTSTSRPSICYAFVNGSLGFPDTIFSLPSTTSLQFMRLESDGHLRLYDMQGQNLARILFDVLSTVMKFCDYPLACGDYGVCSNGQCSCPSLNNFRFQNERLPGAGCIPLSSTSCDHTHDHKLIPLNNVSYFSYSLFLSLAISGSSETVCMKSCLMDCSCKVVLFHNYGPGGDGGYCLMLSEQNLILFADDSTGRFSSLLKIQDNSSGKRRVTVVVSSTIAALTFISTLISVVIWKQCMEGHEQLIDDIPGTPKHFSYGELKIATGHFFMRLGGGGFGSVFKGIIDNETIAVKRLEGIEQGLEEFLAEVKTIGRIHHLNLVRLIGFCAQKSHKLLVYEYLSNRSLDKWIFQKSPIFTLSWKTRRNIIIAIARGLSYLHEECKEKIAHLDIKPQNILLDGKFNAKLSDFGLSKMINRDKSKVMTRMRGTRGYLAPEWLGSTITEKADIYSFGIVMIEIICGRENLDESQPEERIHLISLLQEKARTGQLSDLVDRSSSDMQLHMEEVMQTMKLAMWCLQVDSSKRPLMSTVAKVLEGVTSLEATPDCTFVPTFPTSNTEMVDSGSIYRHSESRLSGPR